MNGLARVVAIAVALAAVSGMTAAHGDTTVFGTYGYDGAGNITGIGIDFYYYDAFGRLKYGTAAAGMFSARYDYDRYGNMTAMFPNGSAIGRTIAVDPQTNQIDANDTDMVFGQYDGAGNMTSYLGVHRFHYDAVNMVKESTASGRDRKLYLYTAGDERIATVAMSGTAESSSSWTLRDPSNKVLRRFTRSMASGTPRWSWEEDYVYRDGTLLAASVNAPEKVRYFHVDHLGTPRLITGNGGALIGNHSYYHFGEETVPSLQNDEPAKFTGHERDPNGLDYMHARYYTAVAGRFLSVDPGPSDLRRPLTWNRYVYAENNPVKNVDGDGRLSNPVTREQGKGKPILHRGGGLGQIRKEQPNVKGSAGGEFGADRAGGRTHKGVDIIAPVGTPLVAAFSGNAYEVRENDRKLGLSVFVRGKNGIVAIYSHLESTNVKPGETIKEGEPVGEAGRSGNVMKEQPASEDHVHFQLYGENGQVTDPEKFLNDPKKQEKYRDPVTKEEKEQ